MVLVASKYFVKLALNIFKSYHGVIMVSVMKKDMAKGWRGRKNGEEKKKKKIEKMKNKEEK